MSTIRRIIAATDFSPAADAALQQALHIGVATGASVEFVTAVHLPPLTEAWRRLVEEEGFSEQRLVATAGARLDEAAARAAFTGPRPATRVLRGRPAQAIAEWAEESAADLLVVGAHGENFLLDLFIGSTALKLLRLTRTPVLLVKTHSPTAYEKIVVATDFSPAARAAAAFAGDLLPQARQHLFHAYEVPFARQMSYAGADDTAIEHYRLRSESEARQLMESFLHTLSGGERRHSLLRHGYPPSLIKNYAAEIDADLVVVGTTGKNDWQASLLGSVSTHLAGELPGDLLLVPPRGDC